MTDRYLGKFRGVVLNNTDPMRLNRLQVNVPDVSGRMPLTWALPCVPVAGLQNGFVALPNVGSSVWVEFERGDPDYPIWVGCFWGSAADVPVLPHDAPPGVQTITIRTVRQNGLTISDLPGPSGGIMLKSATGATLIVNDMGIHIQNGKGASIVMTGPTVTVNAGALVVV